MISKKILPIAVVLVGLLVSGCIGEASPITPQICHHPYLLHNEVNFTTKNVPFPECSCPADKSGGWNKCWQLNDTEELCEKGYAVKFGRRIVAVGHFTCDNSTEQPEAPRVEDDGTAPPLYYAKEYNATHVAIYVHGEFCRYQDAYDGQWTSETIRECEKKENLTGSEGN